MSAQHEIGRLLGESLKRQTDILASIDRQQRDLRKLVEILMSRLGQLDAKVEDVGGELGIQWWSEGNR
jgi:hypothetical protein